MFWFDCVHAGREHVESEAGSEQRQWHVAESQFVDKVEHIVVDSVRSAARHRRRAP